MVGGVALLAHAEERAVRVLVNEVGSIRQRTGDHRSTINARQRVNRDCPAVFGVETRLLVQKFVNVRDLGHHALSATALFQRLFQLPDDRTMSPVTADAVAELVEHAKH
jgi:hypothetical protein